MIDNKSVTNKEGVDYLIDSIIEKSVPNKEDWFREVLPTIVFALEYWSTKALLLEENKNV